DTLYSLTLQFPREPLLTLRIQTHPHSLLGDGLRRLFQPKAWCCSFQIESICASASSWISFRGQRCPASEITYVLSNDPFVVFKIVPMSSTERAYHLPSASGKTSTRATRSCIVSTSDASSWGGGGGGVGGGNGSGSCSSAETGGAIPAKLSATASSTS